MELSNYDNKPNLILFDVYETLLNMSEIERRVNALLDSKRGYIIWFELFMQYCFVDNCTVQFNDFTAIGKATMQMAAKRLGRSISTSSVDEILQLLKHAPLQDGVQEGLSQLHDAGFRIAALTNSPQKIVQERMERTGLISYFEEVLSAEHVKKYKPCNEVYEWASKKLNAAPREILLVTAHGWDIAGGANSGMQTAYIKRGENVLYSLAPEPKFICKNILDLANKLQMAGQKTTA